MSEVRWGAYEREDYAYRRAGTISATALASDLLQVPIYHQWNKTPMLRAPAIRSLSCSDISRHSKAIHPSECITFKRSLTSSSVVSSNECLVLEDLPIFLHHLLHESDRSLLLRGISIVGGDAGFAEELVRVHSAGASGGFVDRASLVVKVDGPAAKFGG